MLLKSLLTIALAAVTTEAGLIKKEENPGFIHVPIHKRLESNGKRDALVQPVVDTEKPLAYYLTSLQVGSNKDNVTLLIDTGSWLTEVLDKDSVCKTCHSYGTYDSHSSTSVKRFKTYKSCFGTNFCYEGDTVTDDVYYGGGKISNYQFGDIHNDTAFQIGILGLSRPPSDSPQESIVVAGKKSGVFKSAAYSFYLESSKATQGGLILGGIDHAKYEGELDYSDISKSNIGGYVSTIEFNGYNLTYNKFLTADTGGAYLYIPSDQYGKFLDALPKDPLNPRNSGKIDYNLIKDKTIKLTLNGKNYDFPADALINPFDIGSQHARIIAYKSDEAQFGADFFRYLYFVVNFDSNTQGVALVKNTTESNIQPI